MARLAAHGEQIADVDGGGENAEQHVGMQQRWGGTSLYSRTSGDP
jgi:hypothetical protein